jgi:hypothetical protein
MTNVKAQLQKSLADTEAKMRAITREQMRDYDWQMYYADLSARAQHIRNEIAQLDGAYPPDRPPWGPQG